MDATPYTQDVTPATAAHKAALDAKWAPRDPVGDFAAHLDDQGLTACSALLVDDEQVYVRSGDQWLPAGQPDAEPLTLAEVLGHDQPPADRQLHTVQPLYLAADVQHLAAAHTRTRQLAA